MRTRKPLPPEAGERSARTNDVPARHERSSDSSLGLAETSELLDSRLDRALRLGHRADLLRAPAAGGDLIARSPTVEVTRRTGGPVVQRQPQTLTVGETTFDNAEWDDPFLKVDLPQGGTLWVHAGKSTRRVSENGYLVNDLEAAYISAYLQGNLRLFRGVGSDHPVYEQALQGLLPPKPDATEDRPWFTSDNSDTRFIPFSTDENIPIGFMRSHLNDESEESDEDDSKHNEEERVLGVVVEVTVGPSKSLGVFDAGEIQVLDPAQGRVHQITASSISYGQRLDREPLTDDDFGDLRGLLYDDMWKALGQGFLGPKVPDGVKKMRQAYEDSDYFTVFKIARDKNGEESSRRDEITATLYREMAAYWETFLRNPLTVSRDDRVRALAQLKQRLLRDLREQVRRILEALDSF